MMDSETQISIVIVTWNAKKYAEECLQSIQNQIDSPTREVIVVDNASVDGTPNMLRRSFPEAFVVQNERNEGFSKANNRGISLSRGRYVCLINSDVVLPPECLSTLFLFMEKNSQVGVSGPRMRNVAGRVARSYMQFPTIWNCFCRASGLSTVFARSRLCRDFLMTGFDNALTAEVDVLNGWFLMVRREALNQVGLLDEQFFMYGEDLDWCYRFHQAGWKKVYFAGASALHYGGASSSSAPLRFYLEMQRANLQFWRKHHGRSGAILYGFIIALHECVRVAGYSLVSLFNLRTRRVAVAKIRRSLACLIWLFDRGEQKGLAIRC